MLRPHRVHLARTDVTFEVRDGETILEAAHRAKYPLPSNCRGGTCRTCMSRILYGQVDHGIDGRLALSEDEYADGYRLLCSAYARSDVEIDR
jgi:ferredoxin